MYQSLEKLLAKHLEGEFLLGRHKINRTDTTEELWHKVVRDAASQIICKPHEAYHLYPGEVLDEDKITLYCTTGNSFCVKEMFRGLLAKLLSGEKPGLAEIIIQINAFLQILMSIDKKTFAEVKKLMDKVESQEYALPYYTLDEISRDVDALIDLICQEYNRLRGNKQDLVLRVQDMVKKNYQNDITLNEIAALFYVTPSYLSRLFKQEAGINLNNYITMVRMEKAKQLLSQTNEKVNDIARMVGYPEANYFTRVFKKYTGYAPNERRSEK
jgi:AraC-like DNA-binding protein